MVRTGGTRKTDASYVSGRLAVARGYLKDARNSQAWAEPGDIGNPSLSTIINCAIAYADVMTAKFRGEINRGDHGAVVKLLRAALGNALPDCQEANLKALWSRRTRSNTGHA